MEQHPCPNCGAALNFTSPALPALVCSHCRTTAMLVSGAVQKAGDVAVLPFDVSPIQIGTVVDSPGGRAEVMGRVRWGWEDGSWNEWLLLDAGGNLRWLGEAMGLFMLLEPVQKDKVRAGAFKLVQQGQQLQLGASATHDSRSYTLVDIKQAICLSSEGALPFSAPTGWKVMSYDWRNPAGLCLSLQKDAREVSLYAGSYRTLEELNPANLRAIEGWSKPDFEAAR